MKAVRKVHLVKICLMIAKEPFWWSICNEIFMPFHKINLSQMQYYRDMMIGEDGKMLDL